MDNKLQQEHRCAVGNPANISDRALTAKDAAHLTGFAPKTLANWRTTGGGPPFVTVGRSIRYMESSTLQWLRDRERRSTSQCLRP